MNKSYDIGCADCKYCKDCSLEFTKTEWETGKLKNVNLRICYSQDTSISVEKAFFEFDDDYWFEIESWWIEEWNSELEKEVKELLA